MSAGFNSKQRTTSTPQGGIEAETKGSNHEDDGNNEFKPTTSLRLCLAFRIKHSICFKIRRARGISLPIIFQFARVNPSMNETTLLLLKPDCVTKKLVGTVLARFEKAGFRVAGLKMMRLTPALLREHYAHLADQPFYPRIEAFMQSSPVLALALEGDNAVSRIRELVGPTDSTLAAPGTIRGDFGVDVMVNIVHASDSVANAAIELARFLKPEEIFNY
jgi:nucleoside-diphosphate kinase